MFERNREYQRLPGRRSRTFSHIRYSLWQGGDHVLQISNSYFTEDYQRFYYRDIQAITVAKTGTAAVRNVILLVLVGLMGVGMFFGGEELRIVLAVSTVVTILVLALNLIRGSSCICFLRTAVQNEQLRSLDRLRLAQRTIARLKPLIEAAQSQFAQEATGTSSPASGPAPRVRPPVMTTEKPRRRETGMVHAAAFGLLLLSGLLTCATIYHHRIGMILLLGVTTVALGVCTLIAVIKQHESDISQELRRTTLGVFGYLCILAVLGYIYWLVFYFQGLGRVKRAEQFYNYWDWLQRFADQSPMDSPFLIGIYIFSIVGSISLGSFGFILLSKHWQRLPSAPPPIPSGPPS